MLEGLKASLSNLFAHDEMGGHPSIESVGYHQQKTILKADVDSKMLKIVYMMLLAGKTLPRYPYKGEFMKVFVDQYTS